jgi:hypothetical protein
MQGLPNAETVPIGLPARLFSALFLQRWPAIEPALGGVQPGPAQGEVE